MIIPLINDTEGRENIGCNLTSKTLKKKIKEEFSKYNIDIEFQSSPYLFNSHPSEILDWWNNQLKNIPLDEFITSKDFNLNLFSLALLEYGKESVDKCLTHNVIFFQPEGTLSIKWSLEKIIGFFSLPLYLKSLKKTIIMINGTIPLYQDHRKDFIKKTINNFDYVFARDQISSEYYNINFMPDAAFAFDYPKKYTIRNRILITTGAGNKKFEDEYILKTGLNTCHLYDLTPIVLTKNTKNFSEYQKIIENMNGIFLESASLENTADMLDSCVLHIGGRYHMAIFCLIRSIPSLLYDIPSHKNAWLSKDFTNIELFKFNDIVLEKINFLIKLSNNIDNIKYYEYVNKFSTALTLIVRNLITNNYDTNFYRI